jgi:gliding motility-associated-like protein
MYYKPTIKATFLLLFCWIQATTFAQNLIKNPDCELPMSAGTIPFWTNITGNLWNARQLDPLAQSGASYFSAGQIKNAELNQTVDVSDYACSIDAGLQSFVFTGYVYSFNQQPQDIAHVIVQYLSATNVVLTAYDSGDKTPLSIWEKLTNTTLAPVGTRSIRLKLISTRQSGTDNDGNYDNLSLTPSPAKVAIDTVQITAAKCSKPNGKLTVKTSGGANLTFKINTGTAQTDSTFQNLLGGNYIVSVVSGTCTVTKNVVVPTTVAPTIDSVNITASICGRPNGKLTVFARSSYPNLSYSLDSLTYRNTRLFDSLSANTYKITLRDSANCTTQQTIIVIDKPGPTLSGFKVDPSVCGKNNGKLSTVVAVSGTAPLNFSVDSVRFKTTSTFDSLSGGNYKLYVKDANGCTASKPFVIKKYDAPVISNLDITGPSCKGGDGVLKIKATSEALPLVFGLDTIRFAPKDTFLNMKSGIYTVAVRDSFGCIAKQNFTMPDPKLPIIEDIMTSIAECGQASATILVKAKSPIGAVKFAIDTVHFQESNTFRNNKKGKYVVTVEDPKGCRATADVELKSNCTVFIPNIFSPNGDRTNDFLSIYGNADDVEKIISFQVFNRWGNLVFNDPTVRLNDPTSGWDGRVNNQELSNDVFVCVVRIQMKGGEILEKMGDVVLSR